MTIVTLAPLRRITYHATRATRAAIGPKHGSMEPYETVEDLFASLPRHRDAEATLAASQGLRPADLVRIAGPGRGKGRHVRHNVVSNREWAVQWVTVFCAVLPLAVLSGVLLGLLFWVV